jgi:DNA polymerase-3 subunit beta
MDVTLQRSDLEAALAIVVGVTDKKSPGMVQRQVLFQTVSEANRLSIQAVGPEASALWEVGAEIKDAGPALVLGELLPKIASSLRPGAVRIRKTETTTIIEQSGTKFRLSDYKAADFPTVPDCDPAVRISAASLSKLIAAAMVSAATTSKTNRMSYASDAVLLTTIGKDKPFLRSVATDGHRMSLANLRCHGAIDGLRLISQSGARAVARICAADDDAEVEIGFTKSHAVFSFEQGRIAANLQEGDYPDFLSVLPKSCESKALVDRDTLAQACGRVAVVTEDGSSKWTFRKGGIEIEPHGKGPDYAKDEVDAEVDGDLVSGLNLRYAMDALKAIPEDSVEIKAQETGPWTFKGKGSKAQLFVVMPVNLHT